MGGLGCKQTWAMSSRRSSDEQARACEAPLEELPSINKKGDRVFLSGCDIQVLLSHESGLGSRGSCGCCLAAGAVYVEALIRLARLRPT